MQPAARPDRPGHQPQPRLRPGVPVLHRTGGRIQVGLGTGSVVLQVDPQAASRFLSTLDGDVAVSDAARRAGLTVRTARRIVGGLVAAGLLDGTASAPLADRTIKVVGCGALGTALACLLATAGLGRLLLADGEPADPVVHPAARPGASNAEALAARLTGPRPGRRSEPADRTATATTVRTLAHWTKPDGDLPDLTVVCTDVAECDRAITETLVREDQPHLLLRGHADGVVVGPYVEPGLASCVRCSDLHRRDRDPEWPLLLHQLSRLHGHPSEPFVAWGAATGAAQVLAWARGGRPETWGATLELGPDWLTRLRIWPAHPACGCSGLTLRT